MDDGNFEMFNNLGTSGWQWLQLQSYDLTAGEHILTITYREDGASLDKLCISNYFEAPTGMGEEAENICVTTGMENESDIPSRFGLEQNYPNPFNPSTVVSYQLPVSGRISIKIYNMLGQKISTLFDGINQAGYHQVSFDGSNLASGIYYYRFIAENYTELRKMLLIK